MNKGLVIVLISLCLPLAVYANVENQDKLSRHSLAVYHGTLNTQKLKKILFTPWETRSEKQQLVAAAYQYSLLEWDPYFSIDWEINVAFLYNDKTLAHFSTLPLFRWKHFPWNDYVRTTAAIGFFGASVATDIIDDEYEDDGGSHYLNFLIPELTFGLPQYPRWDALVRIHHRSGIFGAISGVNGGSNFLSAGVRYRF